jgi:tetratricopeptide (TPR) repeat protein
MTRNGARLLKALAWLCLLAQPVGARPLTDNEGKELQRHIDAATARADAAAAQAQRLLAKGDKPGALAAFEQCNTLTLGYSYHLGLIEGRPVRQGYLLPAPGAEAVRAGVAPGDILVSVNGRSAAGLSYVGISFGLLEVMDPPVITVLRNGAPMTLRLQTPDPNIAQGDAAYAAHREACLQSAIDLYAGGLPRPAVPPIARLAAAKAQTMARAARSKDEISDALSQFQGALFLAPYWADLYVNYAIFQEAVDDPAGAVTSLHRYLQLEPQASDAADIRTKISQLAPMADEERRLNGWSGWWALAEGGRPSKRGFDVARTGNILTISRPNGEDYFKMTIIDDSHAQGYALASSGTVSGGSASQWQRCFPGGLKEPAIWTLSPDRTHLNSTITHLAVNPYNCAAMQASKDSMELMR